jgi:L-ribulose-5-phosphate 4-epimerase
MDVNSVGSAGGIFCAITSSIESIDVLGIAHTHSPYATTFAALGEPIPGCLTTTAMLGGQILLGGYVPIGGEAIGEEIVRRIGNSRAIIMQNHGVFTIGSSPKLAPKMAVEVEEIAHITYMALLRGKPVMLTADQVAEVDYLYRELYGQK